MIVYKPEKVFFAMCVYKFTLDTGFYYYGATTDLGSRISKHVGKNKTMNTEIVQNAFNNAKSVKFEIVRFVNDRKKLSEIELFYLKKHIGKPKCLNKSKMVSCFERTGIKKIKARKERAKKAILQYDKSMNFIARFESAYQAGEKTGISRKDIGKNARNDTKTYRGFIFKFEFN